MQNLSISAEIFRAYDIRGVVGETLTPEIVRAIGKAIGSEIRQEGETEVVVGRDGRVSGPELSKALIEGLTQTGCNVIDVGAVPTPVLYFATYTTTATSGVMLTGSHNPVNHNGLKIVIKHKTLAEEGIQALYQRIQKQDFIEGKGTVTTQDILPTYVAQIAEKVKLARPLKIVVDCGNGIAGVVAPKLFSTLGCEVIPLFCEVDGTFPNHHPDPSIPENLQDLITAVKKHHADVGLAFDGDADRLGVVTNKGEIIWPDRQIMLYVQSILKNLPGATIIYDVKCTVHLKHIIEQAGGKPLMWKTGHSLVKAKLRETNAPFAGEMSGHIFFNDKWYGFDDGIYTGTRLLEILAKQSETLDELFAKLPNSVNTPELKLYLPEERKFLFMDEFKSKAKFPGGSVTLIDGIRVDFANGFGLVRPSNTTPCLVLRFEADNPENLSYIQNMFRDQLLALDKNLSLPF